MLVLFTFFLFYFLWDQIYSWRTWFRVSYSFTIPFIEILSSMNLACVTRDGNNSKRTRLACSGVLVYDKVFLYDCNKLTRCSNSNFMVFNFGLLRYILYWSVRLPVSRDFLYTLSEYTTLIMPKFAGICIFGSWVWNSKECSKSGLSFIGLELHLWLIFSLYYIYCLMVIWGLCHCLINVLQLKVSFSSNSVCIDISVLCFSL